jgi:lipid-binding SYLF domain-containing protein
MMGIAYFENSQSRMDTLMKVRTLLAPTGLSILGLAIAATALASSRADIRSRVTSTVEAFEAVDSSHKSLIGKSAGMLVFPRVTKGGAGVAAEHGEGALLVHGKTVGYYSVGAASVGLTLGLAQHSEIILFMTQESLDRFTASKGWSIGADAGITVVSGGANGSYDSKLVDKPLLAFFFAEKGLIGDLSVEGEKISKIKTSK